MEEYKRLLVLNIDVWNKMSGSDTFTALLSGYPTEKIACVYFKDGVPDSPICDNYFRISENAVIRSIFDCRKKTGACVNKGEFSAGAADAIGFVSAQYKKNGTKRNYFLLAARELLWKLGKWKTRELDAFLDAVAPEAVLFPMEGYIYFNRVCRYVLKKTGARGIGYFWDDNFTYKQSRALGYKLFRFWQRKELKRTVKLCDSFFAIAPKTKREADAFFGVDCKLLTKPIDFTGVEFTPYSAKLPLQILYTGKLIIGRFETVQLLGRALDYVNRDSIKAEVTVYTTTPLSEEQLQTLSPHIHIRGAIPQDAVADVQKQADVLLFAESLAAENSRIARLSFSTKITDYLRSGKCILAIGDRDIAPMEYLFEEDAAITASTYEELVTKLQAVIEDPTMIATYAEKAYACGYKNHNKKEIQSLLFDTINGNS